MAGIGDQHLQSPEGVGKLSSEENISERMDSIFFLGNAYDAAIKLTKPPLTGSYCKLAYKICKKIIRFFQQAAGSPG